jgi:hypothetical protein
MRRILQFILGFPSAVAGGFLNAESDWIRYGLPAILLTAIFFFAIRSETPTATSPRLRPPVGARKTALPAAKTFSVSPFATGDHGKVPSSGIEQGRSMTPPSFVFHPAPPPVQPAMAGLSKVQIAGRRAVCSAVQYSLARVKKKHWKSKAMEMAIQSYRGQGGPQAADGAVSNALTDYAHGTWDESQCTALGGSPLSRGATAEVMR